MVMLFKDLPEEEQRSAVSDVLQKGLPLYGLSPEDDTHVKFAVMLAIKQVRLLSSGEYNIVVPFEVGVDENGLFVTYALNKDVEEAVTLQ